MVMLLVLMVVVVLLLMTLMLDVTRIDHGWPYTVATLHMLMLVVHVLWRLLLLMRLLLVHRLRGSLMVLLLRK